MRKVSKIFLHVLIILGLNTPLLYAKRNVDNLSFFNRITRSENYISASENIEMELPEIDEKDVKNTPKAVIPQRIVKKNVYESIVAVLVIMVFVLYIIKLLCKNFDIPFDYDPNFKSKHITYKRAKNKKYKFQKR